MTPLYSPYSYQNYGFQLPPYQQRYDPPIQQYLQVIQGDTRQIQGKMVDSLDVVKAFDVPLTGEPIFFPKFDMSEIYTKQIQPNGTSRIAVYRMVTEEQPIVESTKLSDKDLIETLTRFKDEITQAVVSNIKELIT